MVKKNAINPNLCHVTAILSVNHLRPNNQVICVINPTALYAKWTGDYICINTYVKKHTKQEYKYSKFLSLWPITQKIELSAKTCPLFDIQNRKLIPEYQSVLTLAGDQAHADCWAWCLSTLNWWLLISKAKLV